MKLFDPRSLKARLIVRLALMQGILLGGLAGGNILVISFLWLGGYLGDGYNQRTIAAVQEAVTRDPAGGLVLRRTATLDAMRTEVRGHWFVVEDATGHRVIDGAIPPDLLPLLNTLFLIDDGKIGRDSGGQPVALVQWIDTEAGRVKIMADVRGRASVWMVLRTAGSSLGIVLFVVILMVISTIIVTPFAVRRALHGVVDVADEAAKIDIRRTGVRLATEHVPTEVAPLVVAVNAALARIDLGYEQHKRFLADAAHELQTPIAILRTRIAGLPKGPDRTRLSEDASRLTVLTGQLLDLQRLEAPNTQFKPVDLIALAQRVVLDMAPLVFAAGYTMAFDIKVETARVAGDEGALERAVTNLVQNAIDYGGRRGEISVQVMAGPAIEVCDDGDGIPADEQEAVFAPFHRLARDGMGNGLGLDLVQRTMQLHGGAASVTNRTGRGACFRLAFLI